MMGLLKRKRDAADDDEQPLSRQLDAFAQALEERAREANHRLDQERRRLDRLNNGGPPPDVP